MQLFRYAEIVFGFYWVSFLVKLLGVFLSTFYKSNIVFQEMKEADAYCLGNNRIQSIMTESCHKAKEYLQTTPSHRAWSSVIDHCYSCGHVSCQDVVLSVLNSWAGLTFVFLLAVLVVFFMMKRMEDSKHKSRSNIDRTFHLPNGALGIQFSEINQNGQRRTILENVGGQPRQRMAAISYQPDVEYAN